MPPLTRDEIERQRAEAIERGKSGAKSSGGSTSTTSSSAPLAGATPTSRLTLARAAIRPAMKGRVMLSGPPGAGKTYTALVIATVLVGPDGKILLVDSEKESSLTYADVFSFEQLPWNPPFDPTSLSLTLRDAASEYDAIIVDSFSHWWRKKGGVLDIAGDNFRGWKDARPVQEDLIETILDVDAHVIVCCRSKMDHVVGTDDRGRTTIDKVGIKAQQDDDLEYEVNVALEVDMSHVLHVAKSRTNAVPVGSQFLSGLAGDFAQHYREWLAAGEPVASKDDTDWLVARLNEISDEGKKRRAKSLFLSTFGRPEFLLESRLPDARQWVVDALEGTLPVDRGEDDTPPDPGSSSPDSGSGNGQAATAEDAAQPPAAAADPPVGDGESAAGTTAEGPFNGDAGHCDQCGGAVWYAATEDDGGPGWLHADEVDDSIEHERDVAPLPDGENGDALYLASHGPDVNEARIRAEVQAMKGPALTKACKAEGVAGGPPPAMREGLIAKRLGALTS